MTKKGPLSKAERFYIENHLDKPLEDLCKDLDRAKSTVNKYLSNLAVNDRDKTATLLYNQFARNEKGSVVMTENAAVHSDEFKLKSKGVTTERKRKNCTTNVRK